MALILQVIQIKQEYKMSFYLQELIILKLLYKQCVVKYFLIIKVHYRKKIIMDKMVIYIQLINHQYDIIHQLKQHFILHNLQIVMYLQVIMIIYNLHIITYIHIYQVLLLMQLQMMFLKHYLLINYQYFQIKQIKKVQILIKQMQHH